MPITIANFADADRRSAKAGEAITMGMIVKMSGDVNGERFMMKLGNGDSAELVAGKYAIAYKVSADSAQVAETTAPASTGDRTVTIVSGDQVVECRRGSIVEYTADVLHSSLDPARGGTTPVVGDKLEIVGSLPCKAGTGSAITSPIVLRVYAVHGTNVQVELV